MLLPADAAGVADIAVDVIFGWVGAGSEGGWGLLRHPACVHVTLLRKQETEGKMKVAREARQKQETQKKEK